MSALTLTHRIARVEDLPALHALMNRAIGELQKPFLSPDQIRASYSVMGLDSQLVRDGTYFAVESGGVIVGCGGWSYRATLFGGDASVVARDASLLDPAADAARVRAMYTDPEHIRRGIGTLILALCEGAAAGAGFGRVELMATAAGVPLYRAAGYRPADAATEADIGGVKVPLLRMVKDLPRPGS